MPMIFKPFELLNPIRVCTIFFSHIHKKFRVIIFSFSLLSKICWSTLNELISETLIYVNTEIAKNFSRSTVGKRTVSQKLKSLRRQCI